MSCLAAIKRLFAASPRRKETWEGMTPDTPLSALSLPPWEWPRVADPGRLPLDAPSLVPTPPPPSQPAPEPKTPEEWHDTGFRAQRADPEDPEDPLTRDILLDCDPRAFCNRLRRGVNEVYGGDAAAFYRAAGITRYCYSRLLSHPRLHPAKKTALAMAAALHMDLPAAEEFLKLAGYALSPAFPVDQVWHHCFQHRIFDIARIAELIHKVQR